MDVEVKVINRELKPESTVNIKTESDDENISIVSNERDLDIETHIKEILGITIKKEYEDDIYKLNFKKNEVSEVKVEPCSHKEEEESFPDIKTEELMLKSESDDSDTSDEEEQQKTKKYELYPMAAIREENALKKYNCEICDYRTSRIGDLKRHITTKHLENPKKRYGCDLCVYKAHVKTSLTKHILVMKHMLVKHDEMSFKQHGCNFCDYRTHDKSNLKRHVIVKHDRNSGDLKRHVNMKHTLLKKYSCNLCDHKTYYKSDLMRHILCRHDKNSFKKHGCDLCDYRTHQKSGLKRHMKNKHKTNSNITTTVSMIT